MPVTRTNDEILCFLVRNAVPDKFIPTDGMEGPGKPERLRQLLLRLSGPTRYTVPLDLFEEFIGEKFSFERHLRPLHESNALRFRVAKSGSNYDSPEYREIFDHTNGLVQASDPPGQTARIAFYIGGQDDFITTYQEVVKNAVELGLLKF